MVPTISPTELKDGTTSPFPAPSVPSRYAGVVVLVTGASSGIGEAIALTYAQQGCSVVVAARRKNRLDELVQRISESHPQARGFAVDCDVTNVADRKRLVEKSVEFARTVPGNSGGFLHRVFLNQGISQNSKFEELAEETEVEMMEVNFFANVRLTRLLLPILTSGANASSDTILRPRLTYVASALARLPAPYNTIYCASKSALCTFFDCLRYEVPFKIVGVLPGPVRTEMIGKLRGPRGQIVEMVVDDPSVVQRATRSDDVKGKLPESVIMSASEAARLAALATEREVREVTYPPLDRAMAKVRFGNAEGQEVWDGPRSVGDTMQRMYAVPVSKGKM